VGLLKRVARFSRELPIEVLHSYANTRVISFASRLLKLVRLDAAILAPNSGHFQSSPGIPLVELFTRFWFIRLGVKSASTKKSEHPRT